MVKHNYWAFVGLCLCLSWNFMGVTMAWGAGALEDDSAASWFLSALYLVCGVPLGFILWYLRLYHATQKDSALTYAGYFLFKCVGGPRARAGTREGTPRSARVAPALVHPPASTHPRTRPPART